MDEKFDAKQQHDQTQDLQARSRMVMGEKLEVSRESRRIFFGEG